jgi:hypothetical protein
MLISQIYLTDITSQQSLIETTNQLTSAATLMANRMMNSMLPLLSTLMLPLLSTLMLPLLLNCCGPSCVMLHMCLATHFLHAFCFSSPHHVHLSFQFGHIS